MIRLIKAELGYFKPQLWGIVLLILIFTIFAINRFELFSNIVFLKKYFWSMTIGLGAYGLVFILWMQRVKEKHEQMIFLLPVSMDAKKWSRWIFAILPFISVLVYIQIFHFFLPESWNVHVGRISAQIGFLSMALASIFITRDIWFVNSDNGYIYKILIAGMVFAITATGAVLIMAIFNYNIIEPLYVHQEELFFFLWGVIISAASLITYGKRKVFLE